MILAALLLAAANPPAFQYCISCHSVDPAETGLPAPNLDGLVGRRAGSRANFEYSPAMQAAGDAARGGGLVWTRETLKAFLANPQAMVPGTAMQRLPPDTPVDEVVEWLARR